MIKRKFVYGLCAAALCSVLSLGNTMEARADYEELSGPAFSTGDYIVSIEEGKHSIYASMDSYEVLTEAPQGNGYVILSDRGNGWMEVQAGDGVGYISVTEEGVSVVERAEQQASEALAVTRQREEEYQAALEAQRQIEENNSQRQKLVNFALQFVGGRYRAGGNDPHTGADCSGFTRYVMLYGAGVSIDRSSSAQSRQGVEVSADQMRPGDLIFYGSGRRVNHVAMYIGNGQIVHASTYKTGIKISPWNYRTPIAIRNVLGD